METDNPTIKICKTLIPGEKSNKFHGLIYDPESAKKSLIEIVKTLMKLFKNPSGNRCEEQTLETQLPPSKLLHAIEKRVVVPGLKFSICKTVGGVLAEFYAEDDSKKMKACDVMDFIMMHQQLLQTPEPVEKKNVYTRLLYPVQKKQSETQQ